MESINEYQTFCSTTWTDDEKNLHTQRLHAALGIAGEAGEVAELFKKDIRGDNGPEGGMNHDKLIKELGDVMYYVVTVARLYGVPASMILQTNVDKLSSRKARGVIKGSGDER